MVEKIPFPKRDIEKIKEREEKRKELRKILPVDLQLEFEQERPEKEKWFFRGELLKRRHSEIDEDKLFFEALREVVENKDLGRIKEIEEKVKENRKKIAENLNKYLFLKSVLTRTMEYLLPRREEIVSVAELAVALAKIDPESARSVMERCFIKREAGLAGKIALALNDLESAKKAMEECFALKKFSEAAELAVALAKSDPESAKIAMKICFDNKKPDLAGKIALALNDLELAKKAMEECFRLRWFPEAAELAVALAKIDPESARSVMERCFIKREAGLAGKIALALNDLESAKKAMEECFELWWFSSAAELAVALAKSDPESAKIAMKICFDNKKPDLAGKIALALNDLELAKKAMEECFRLRWFPEAAELAVALAKIDPESARKIMEKYFNVIEIFTHRDLTSDEERELVDLLFSSAKIAVALAKRDPELAIKAMEVYFTKDEPWLAAEIAIALAEGFQPFPETKRLFETMNQLRLGIYEKRIIIHLLSENQDLRLLKTKYLPQYLFIKKFAKEINEKMDEAKKWKNPEEFFEKHAEDIANLHSIDLNLSTQLLKIHIQRGLSFAEAYLDIFRPVFENEEIVRSIKEYIASNKKLDGQNFSDLLEISSAYQRMDEGKILVDILNQSKGKEFKELKLELNKNLLKKLAEKLGIKAEISEQDVKEWKLKYFANLLSNKEMLKSEEDLEVFNSLLKSVFEGKFEDFISNPDQKDEIGREIALHNKKVEEEFKEKGIDWENWLNFKGVERMNVGTKKKQEREALFRQFEDRLKDWLDKVDSRLKGALNKDIEELRKKKKEFDPSKINLSDPQWQEKLFPNYSKALDYLKKKYPDFEISTEAQEAFSHLVETIKLLSEKERTEETERKEFIVKLWDRDPRRDLFQGNETGCCIAVGVKEAPPGAIATLHPETILQYLIDKGINVAEIVDPDTGDVVAQTWLFVTLDENKKPVLIADNFEVNKKYPAGTNVNRGIREAMFEFLKKYAKACNIEKVGLGKVGTNDVETGDLETLKLPPIKKLGGYFGRRKYYLETLGRTEVYEIK